MSTIHIFWLVNYKTYYLRVYVRVLLVMRIHVYNNKNDQPILIMFQHDQFRLRLVNLGQELWQTG